MSDVLRAYALALLERCRRPAEPPIADGPVLPPPPEPTPPEMLDWAAHVKGAACQNVRLYGMHDDSRSLNTRRIWSFIPDWREQRWYPIGDDYCGNYYVFRDKPRLGTTPSVCFFVLMVSEDVPVDAISTSFWGFLIRVLEPESGEKLPAEIAALLRAEEATLAEFRSTEQMEG